MVELEEDEDGLEVEELVELDELDELDELEVLGVEGVLDVISADDEVVLVELSTSVQAVIKSESAKIVIKMRCFFFI